MHQNLIKRCLSSSSSSSSSSSFGSTTFTVKRLVSEGLYEQALIFFQRNVHPFQSNTTTHFIIPSITKACAYSHTHQFLGHLIHCNVLKSGFDSESTVSNSLISMYAKFSDASSAKKLFDDMPDRDTISWSSMINCCTQNGFLVEALEMFREMYRQGFVPKPELLASCLSACVKVGDWRLGRALHGLVVIDERVEKSVFVSTALLDFYSRFNDLDSAFRIFDVTEEKNEVSWTAMISGCIEVRAYDTAFACLKSMQFENVKPNKVTLISILPACIKLRSIRLGKEIHGYAVRHGLHSDAKFSSALVHMYCECRGGLRLAKLIFDRSMKKEIVMWSSIIAGYSRDIYKAREAIRLFGELHMEGILPNNVTLLAVISACTNLLSLRDGSGVHGYSLKSGFGTDVFIQNALVNMYSKCGNLTDSVQVFNEMTTRDCVSWSSLIGAYGLHGYAEKALSLFYEMQESGIKADGLTYLAALSTCNHAGLVEKGQMLFSQVSEDVNVSLTLEHYACYVDLLGRAGKLEDACSVMSSMVMRPSSKMWSSLVSACKLHGRLDIAESVARRLIEINPENAANYTLLSMIYAECGNWLRVEELRRYMKDRKLVKNRSLSKVQLHL